MDEQGLKQMTEETKCLIGPPFVAGQEPEGKSASVLPFVVEVSQHVQDEPVRLVHRNDTHVLELSRQAMEQISAVEFYWLLLTMMVQAALCPPQTCGRTPKDSSEGVPWAELAECSRQAQAAMSELAILELLHHREQEGRVPVGQEPIESLQARWQDVKRLYCERIDCMLNEWHQVTRQRVERIRSGSTA